MTAFIAAAFLALAQGQGPVWVWTLYEGAGAVVLANERPDTPDLRTTLECVTGSGLAKVSLYEATAKVGQASLSSGNLTTGVEAIAGAEGTVVAPLRTDQSVFARFVTTGVLAVSVGETRKTITVGPSDLAKLRRFADLCGGR